MKRNDFKVFVCPECNAMHIYYFGTKEEGLLDFSEMQETESGELVIGCENCEEADAVVTDHKNLPPEIIAEIYGDIEEDRNKSYTNTGYDVLSAMRKEGVDNSVITKVLINLVDSYVERTT